ncbi:glycogen synthase [Dimargaris cristalligena]|uniref:Glycogen [starch] synthase n=1 Tax=Dimargaris cristalligena TaxID=215637 RepID=A0A4V1J5W2_9FUNG|nr:glycogen synthase [Dimargaris cristalligena]|eukprot:RKP40449.1 glycogen synthase [Dimargaris cristalligena]
MPENNGLKQVTNPVLFECAWEVANKVGGIYTVIKTKAPVTVQEFGNRYCLLGPLNHRSAPVEVEAMEPTDPAIKSALDNLRSSGINVLYGRWLIDGAPTVCLFDLGSVANRLNEWKGDIWNIAGIPSPPSDTETNDAILLGYMVAQFLGEYVAHNTKNAVIAHFHEWQSGVGAILVQKRKLNVATIFTTHATLLGRYLCAGNEDFYNNLSHFDVDHEAGKRGIYHRYCLERAATHCVNVFTTVSHITAYEAEHLLKRKPDGVVPNGLNVIKFNAMHEFQNIHAISKEKIHNFVRGHFYGHFDFNLDNTLYFFIAGRYEYRNKGVDMYIEALSRLNTRLKNSGSSMTVVAFIIMPAKTHSFTVETLKGQALVKQLQETVDEIQARIGERIFEEAARGHEINVGSLMKDEEKILLKRRTFALKRHTLPPIVTHNMADDSTDPVLNQLRHLSLFNHPSDRVKIVFHPEFLNANNPILGLDYEDFIRGCHLGVFPSYYEPWGYTPAECTVMGVPSVTTNLSGFGCFMEDNIETPSEYGIYIVDRRMKSADESIEQLCSQMFEFTQKTRRQRINQRNRVERLSDLLDWKRMGIEYMKARQLALRRSFPDSFSDDYFNSQAGANGSSGGKIPRPLSAPGSPHSHGYDNEEDHPSAHLAGLDMDGLQISTESYANALLHDDEDEEDLRPPIKIKTKTPPMTPRMQ